MAGKRAVQEAFGGSTDEDSSAGLPLHKQPRIVSLHSLERRALHFRCNLVVGPMVGASDLAFRRLCRRHGADTCYTEMLFSQRLIEDAAYRMRKLRTCAEDAPLVVQFCGNDPATLAAAARLVRG